MFGYVRLFAAYSTRKKISAQLYEPLY